jgi:hypothetical protein
MSRGVCEAAGTGRIDPGPKGNRMGFNGSSHACLVSERRDGEIIPAAVAVLSLSSVAYMGLMVWLTGQAIGPFESFMVGFLFLVGLAATSTFLTANRMALWKRARGHADAAPNSRTGGGWRVQVSRYAGLLALVGFLSLAVTRASDSSQWGLVWLCVLAALFCLHVLLTMELVAQVIITGAAVDAQRASAIRTAGRLMGWVPALAFMALAVLLLARGSWTDSTLGLDMRFLFLLQLILLEALAALPLFEKVVPLLGHGEPGPIEVPKRSAT